MAKNGRVIYNFKDGQAGFADDGDCLTFGRKEVSDEALMAAIRYAADKWGGELHLTGGDAIFKERVLRVAVAHNIVVKNPELQQLQTQLRTSFYHAHVDPAYQDILSLVTTRNAYAQVRRPDGKTKSFTGQIVGENSLYVVQHIGANDYIVHAKSVFKVKKIDTGKPVTVKYQDTTATITSRADRPKGGR